MFQTYSHTICVVLVFHFVRNVFPYFWTIYIFLLSWVLTECSSLMKETCLIGSIYSYINLLVVLEGRLDVVLATSCVDVFVLLLCDLGRFPCRVILGTASLYGLTCVREIQPSDNRVDPWRNKWYPYKDVYVIQSYETYHRRDVMSNADPS